MPPAIAKPRNWPIGARLTALFLILTLVPLLLVTLVTIATGLDAVERAALQILVRTAETTAARLDQLVADTRDTHVLFATDRRAVEACLDEIDPDRPLEVGMVGRDIRRERVEEEARTLIAANPSITAAFVLDTSGGVIVATSPPGELSRDQIQPIVTRALAGEEFSSGLMLDHDSGRPRVYLGGPVRDHAGDVIGAAIIAIDGRLIWQAAEEVIPGAKGYATISDEHGIVIAHQYPEARFRSLGTLSRETIDRIDPRRRWGLSTIISVGLEDLQQRLPGARQSGHAYFPNPVAPDELWVGGYAPMRELPWVVSVVQPNDQFVLPLKILLFEMLIGVVAVAGVTALIGLVFSRSIVRPIRALTTAAERIASGDFAARAAVDLEDELGALARSFNAIVPALEERGHMRESLRLANEVQQHLLPSAPPVVEGLDVHGVSIPCDETGGDYFDFLDMSPWKEGSLGVTVGDVTGHGIAAALLMTTARAMLRARAVPPGELDEMMRDVNVRLAGDISRGRFMTLFYMLIDARERAVRWVSAGHDPAITYDPASNTFAELIGSDIPLGIDPGWAFTEHAAEGFGRGRIVLIGTDGVWESRNPRGEMFGKSALRRLIRENADRSSEQIIAAVLDALNAFRAHQPAKDDATLIVVKHL
jgi:sigma-B regulation protein RsbU (phosphoserine phosphatase)